MARIIAWLLVSLSALALAVDISGQVHWNGMYRNGTVLGYASALLDEGVHYGGVISDGKFTISDVSDGTYILSINSHDYVFDQYRVDVSHTSTPQVEVRPYIPGTPMDPPSNVLLPYPLSVTPREKYVYFMPRESFNLGGMLSNPMMLAMIGCGLLVLVTPYIVKNLDPEALEEFKKEQARTFHPGEVKSSSSAVEEQIAPGPRINKAGSGAKGKASNKKGRR